MKVSKMKKLAVCTSWKMNFSVNEAINYTKNLNDFINKNICDNSQIEVFIIADFLSLYPISRLLKKSKLKYGAQDCFWEDKGAYYGEISPMFLKEIGCDYVFVGHPERRKYLKEDTKMINKKLKACLRNKLTPILAIIEKEKDLSIEKTSNKLKDELLSFVDGVDQSEINNIFIIYEPGWAIGTSETAPISHTYHIISKLRDTIDREFGPNIGQNQVILYGGGVRLNKVREIMELDNVNGIGMGKAGLDLKYFTGAVKVALEIEDISRSKLNY